MNDQLDETTQEQPVVETAPVAAEQPVNYSASIDAIKAYQDWLSNQPRQVGPFGIFWNAEEGQALVKAYCKEQGWS